MNNPFVDAKSRGITGLTTMPEDTFIPVVNRGVTGPDGNGNYGISFDVKNSSNIIRMQISPEMLASFANSALSYLDYSRHRLSHADKSSGIPSLDVSPAPSIE